MAKSEVLEKKVFYDPLSAEKLLEIWDRETKQQQESEGGE